MIHFNACVGMSSPFDLCASAGFLFTTWLTHWLPFNLMDRQLFLHHYLPALYVTILLAAFPLHVCLRAIASLPPIARALSSDVRDNDRADTSPTSTPSSHDATGALDAKPSRPHTRRDLLSWGLVGLLACVLVSGFYRFSPITYGLPMTRDQCDGIKWLSTWDINCNDLPSGGHVQAGGATASAATSASPSS